MALSIDHEAIASHRAVLTAACARTAGPIIEVGAGIFSTPLLAEIAAIAGRVLVTVEHDPDWRPAAAPPHHVVTDSLALGAAMFERYGVALIDGPAAEREVAVRLLLPKCELLVIHDTESLDDYPGLREALASARHRRDFPMPTTTTVVSDQVPW